MSISVGITMRVVNALNYNEPRDAISHDWINLFINENLKPVLIPNCGDEVEQFLQMNRLENGGFIFLHVGQDAPFVMFAHKPFLLKTFFNGFANFESHFMYF